MANNIVQLEDRSGNNIFPVAGSMAVDSITTAMIQDGAVTADKIDFATSEATITFPNTHAVQHSTKPLTVKKFGKMVFIEGSVQLTGYSSYTDTLSSDISNAVEIPTGFRPSVDLVYVCQATGNRIVRVLIGTDGKLNIARCNYLTGSSSTQALYTDTNPAINICVSYLAA